MGLFWSPPNMFFIAEVYAACLAGLWVGANGAASPLWKDSSFNFAPDQAYPSTQVNDVPLTDFVVSDLYEVKEHHRRSIGGLLGRIIVAAVIAAIAFVLLRCFISLKQKPSDWTSRHLAEGKLDVECQEYSYTIMRIDAPTPKLKKTEKSEHSIATKEVLQELRTKYYAPVSTRSQKIVSHGLCFQFDITEVGPVPPRPDLQREELHKAEKDLPTAVTPRGEGHALRVSRASLVQQEEELAPQAIQNEPKEQEDEKPGSDKGADPFAESSDSEDEGVLSSSLGLALSRSRARKDSGRLSDTGKRDMAPQTAWEEDSSEDELEGETAAEQMGTLRSSAEAVFEEPLSKPKAEETQQSAEGSFPSSVEGAAKSSEHSSGGQPGLRDSWRRLTSQVDVRSPRSKRRNALSRKILSTSSPDLRTMVLANLDETSFGESSLAELPEEGESLNTEAKRPPLRDPPPLPMHLKDLAEQQRVKAQSPDHEVRIQAAAATWSLYFSLLGHVRTLMQDAEARYTLRASTRFVVGKREFVLQCSVRNSLFELDEEDIEEKVLRWTLPR